MASVFTKIIDGELPARFVWKDDRCVAFLSINPLTPGHTLVVPRDEVDHWLDLPPELLSHIMEVARKIGVAVQDAFEPERVGLIIAGLEVPHVHIHVVAIDRMRDLDFANADPSPPAAALESAAGRIRSSLRAHGHPETSD